MSGPGPYWGKYRGTVLINVDPEFRGRLICRISEVLGEVPSTWVEPCIPLSGATGLPMGVYLVPPIDAAVWIEFEHGDPNLPIWVGCQWATGRDVPPMALAGVPASPNMVFQTSGKNMIVMSDLLGAAGGVMIQSGSSTLSVNQSGVSIIAPKVEISAGQIKLVGETDINMGALKIT